MAKSMKSRSAKKSTRKQLEEEIWNNDDWKVVSGVLVPGPGRSPKTPHLFRYVAEKLPYESLRDVRAWMKKNAVGSSDGVYLAHDSMGVARYGGRGQIFARLTARKKKYPKELAYFSFYVVEDKKHEREIETALLRAAGPLLTLNTNKVSSDIEPGRIKDYEPRTLFLDVSE